MADDGGLAMTMKNPGEPGIEMPGWEALRAERPAGRKGQIHARNGLIVPTTGLILAGICVLAGLSATALAQSATDVLTHHNDNFRTGANLMETRLTTDHGKES